MKTITSRCIFSVVTLTSLITFAGDIQKKQPLNVPAETTPPSEQDAQLFLESTEAYLIRLNQKVSRAKWIHANFITYDTSELVTEADAKKTAAAVRLAHEASRFNNLELGEDTRRKLDKLKLALTLPAPQNAEKNSRLSKTATELSNLYGKGKYCQDDNSCLSLGEISTIMASSRDYDELLKLWLGWHDIAKPMRPLYEQEVGLANEGAKELGYADTGAMWRSKYDMPADDFARDIDRLWNQIQPLYQSLHCHVRAKLGELYGEDKVPQNGPIPAHLLGNMWAQNWDNIYNLVAPEGDNNEFNVTEQLKLHNYDELKMVRTAENFFISMGFPPLPDTFYERSLFTKPSDRDVQCHASAWILDNKDDLRIKMCIQRTGKGFSVIHHELGHNFYQRAYNKQPVYFQQSANDGFHEAVGDTIALSVTPGYLQEIGLLDEIPDTSKDIAILMKMALDKVAFIPFGLLVDQWRWKVFSGEVTPENYNKTWWEFREKYQGITAPTIRTEEHFDPGAKYHVPNNTPYSRYFLAHILQFEFHRTLCDKAGNKDPIHRCSLYNSKEAGLHLNRMLEAGSSRPWQETFAELTGKQEMDASAILDYFAPLQEYLDEQNKGRLCGW